MYQQVTAQVLYLSYSASYIRDAGALVIVYTCKMPKCIMHVVKTYVEYTDLVLQKSMLQ